VSPSLRDFAEPVRRWFGAALGTPTRVQELGWPALRAGRSALLFAPTGSGKTLAAFLAALDRLMFQPAGEPGVKVLYVSPLKALAVDVERNLRVPLAGIEAAARELGVDYRRPELALRSGDTPARERAQFLRKPSDILITTPESLYLLLTSEAQRRLSGVRTLIIDEIHSLLASKRGAHLALSLERLEALRQGQPPLQRIGLSATQRPYDEAARLLGGYDLVGERAQPRAVDVIDASAAPAVTLSIEVPVDGMARPADAESRSIWPGIHGPLLELVRAHRSTLVFVNNRRLAERLSLAINDLAGEELMLAHHGSVARERRSAIEEALKRGELRALAATSSLELGIDMGAIDLVVQIESPPSIAAGLQRIGRAGHAVGEISRGVVFPKFRGDLLACAAAAAAILSGDVEATRYARNPLDVLAQQIVAIVSERPIAVSAVYELVRRAAPFAELARTAFEGTLDMLSGRYPSDEFAELRPRITWDRLSDTLSPRQGSRSVAIINGGTIPDRGLFGVYLAASDKPVRVGELDEEMVFESRSGDVFLLGASSWRIEEITHDRVLVSPAPGQPGKMPFWHGDRAGRSLELGRRIGALTRQLTEQPAQATALLTERHALAPQAAQSLLAYLEDQERAAGVVPSDVTLVIERFVDEVGDQRVCLLSPFGTRVHAPWAVAILERERQRGRELEAIWSDDGIVFRLPEAQEAPGPEVFTLEPAELDELVTLGLGRSSLFASRFRENAARALLLPRRHPQRRSPLWAQRKRAADLLAVAARFPAFPILLETYRDLLSDVFDLAGLRQLMSELASRKLELRVVDGSRPSPFASTLLFSYASNFIYEGDAPLAERRAQALSIDHEKLRELLGEAELRELLAPQAIADWVRRLQRLSEERHARHADHVHDMLIAIGDLSLTELRERVEAGAELERWLTELEAARRVVRLKIAGQERYAAVEDAGKLSAALGLSLPEGLPAAFLERGARPLHEVVARFARTHGPFAAGVLAQRFGLGLAVVEAALADLVHEGRVVEGAFLAAGSGREYCDREVLTGLRQKSLNLLRAAVEPVPASALAVLYADWQGLLSKRSGADALLAAIERLEGASLPASRLETDFLPARIPNYRPAMLDELMLSGEVTWLGLAPLAEVDGRIALYRSEHFELLAPEPRQAEGELCARLRATLARRGASFFPELVRESGSFPPDVLSALWDMVWAGEVRNDTLLPLRSRLGARANERRGRGRAPRPRAAPGSEGRWSLVSFGERDVTARRLAQVRALLDRFGVVTREAVASDGLELSFADAYPVLRALEQGGKVRRGYFVAGLGGAQFAEPGADDRLRLERRPGGPGETLLLSAVDPANPYGAALPWPPGGRCQRSAGAYVVLFRGELVAYLGKTEQSLTTFLPGEGLELEQASRAVAAALVTAVDGVRRRALLIAEINGEDPAQAAVTPALLGAGFSASSQGLLLRSVGDRQRAPPSDTDDDDEM
jgi:ATP-dependent helicase Lhr and Lhr-like helicase